MRLLSEAATAAWSGLNFQRSEAESQQGEAYVKMDSSQGKPVQIEVSSQDVDLLSRKGEEFSAQLLQRARPAAPPKPAAIKGRCPTGQQRYCQPCSALCSWRASHLSHPGGTGP